MISFTHSYCLNYEFNSYLGTIKLTGRKTGQAVGAIGFQFRFQSSLCSFCTLIGFKKLICCPNYVHDLLSSHRFVHFKAHWLALKSLISGPNYAYDLLSRDSTNSSGTLRRWIRRARKRKLHALTLRLKLYKSLEWTSLFIEAHLHMQLQRKI